MKLRNKQTPNKFGEIVPYDAGKGEGIAVKTDQGIVWYYHSLGELNEEWEDYEEPKPQVVYYIDRDGEIVPYRNIEYPKRIFNAEQNKEIGNYFDTREEAEKAVEKLKAWKRLKDIGCSFDGWNVKTAGSEGDHLIINLYIKDCTECDELLDLLFGGEE